MKLVKLTNNDINKILDRAMDFFNQESPKNRERGFMAHCILESALEYFNKKDYIIKNGKIYKN